MVRGDSEENQLVGGEALAPPARGVHAPPPHSGRRRPPNTFVRLTDPLLTTGSNISSVLRSSDSRTGSLCVLCTNIIADALRKRMKSLESHLVKVYRGDMIAGE